MTKLTAIITAHKDTPAGMIQNLEEQTTRPAKMLIGISSWKGDLIAPKIPAAIEFMQNKEDFGYDKRNRLLRMVDTEYVGFFNHDDSYELNYVELMLATAKKKDADVVSCRWDQVDQLGCFVRMRPWFRPGTATLGSFIARTSMLLDVGGFPTDINDSLLQHVDGAVYGYEGTDVDLNVTARGWSDSRLIWALRRQGASTAEVDEVLYHRNMPYKGVARPMVWGERR